MIVKEDGRAFVKFHIRCERREALREAIMPLDEFQALASSSRTEAEFRREFWRLAQIRMLSNGSGAG